MTDKPEWMNVAEKYLGQTEATGNNDGPWIDSLWANLGWKKPKPDRVAAWCAVYAAFCLKAAGCDLKGLDAMARSFKRCTIKLNAKQDFCYGAVVVLSLPHVGFIVGHTRTHVQVLGGNQSNGVTLAWFKKDLIEGIYWPDHLKDYWPKPGAVLPVLKSMSGAMGGNTR